MTYAIAMQNSEGGGGGEGGVGMFLSGATVERHYYDMIALHCEAGGGGGGWGAGGDGNNAFHILRTIRIVTGLMS